MAGIEAIAGLMLIHLHLKKLQGRFHLRGFLLPSNYIIKSIIGTSGLNELTWMTSVVNFFSSFLSLIKNFLQEKDL